MLVASSYPFLNIFWTMMVFFFWVMYVFVVIWALIDNFRRSDHSGGAKALWTLFIIVLPAIGGVHDRVGPLMLTRQAIGALARG